MRGQFAAFTLVDEQSVCVQLLGQLDGLGLPLIDQGGQTSCLLLVGHLANLQPIRQGVVATLQFLPDRPRDNHFREKPWQNFGLVHREQCGQR